MRKRWIWQIGAVAAAVGLMTGCSGGENAGGQGDGPDSSPTGAELQALIDDGTLPKDFPANGDRVRLVQDGTAVAASWVGPALAAGCEPAKSTPGSHAQTLLLQDVPLENIQVCGGFWQATQADNSQLLWNEEG